MGTGKRESEVRRLLEQLDSDPRARESLVNLHQGLVTRLAQKFTNKGESMDDLVQIGNLALLKAIDGYDRENGTQFSTYAVPTILGELKRYFRDKSWDLKVSRGIKELAAQVRQAEEVLGGELGRPPKITEIAKYLGVRPERVRQAQGASQVFRALSLDAQPTSESEEALGYWIGHEEQGYEQVLNRRVIRDALVSLGDRERQILFYRYYEELSQARAATLLGISQMHVSRLERRALRKLKKLLEDRRKESGTLTR